MYGRVLLHLYLILLLLHSWLCYSVGYSIGWALESCVCQSPTKPSLMSVKDDTSNPVPVQCNIIQFHMIPYNAVHFYALEHNSMHLV